MKIDIAPQSNKISQLPQPSSEMDDIDWDREAKIIKLNIKPKRENIQYGDATKEAYSFYSVKFRQATGLVFRNEQDVVKNFPTILEAFKHLEKGSIKSTTVQGVLSLCSHSQRKKLKRMYKSELKDEDKKELEKPEEGKKVVQVYYEDQRKVSKASKDRTESSYDSNNGNESDDTEDDSDYENDSNYSDHVDESTYETTTNLNSNFKFNSTNVNFEQIRKNLKLNTPNLNEKNANKYIGKLITFNADNNLNITSESDIMENIECIIKGLIKAKNTEKMLKVFLTLCSEKNEHEYGSSRDFFRREFKKFKKANQKHKGKIYKLSSSHFEEIYIGSTTLDIKTRLANHKNLSNTCTSKKLFTKEPDTVKIEVLEEIECTKEELRQLENKWIEEMSKKHTLLNKNKACLIEEDKDIKENNKENISAQVKQEIKSEVKQEVKQEVKSEDQIVKDAFSKVLDIYQTPSLRSKYENEISKITNYVLEEQQIKQSIAKVLSVLENPQLKMTFKQDLNSLFMKALSL
jgi:hypothetical protein